MTRFQKGVLIASGILAIGIVGLAATPRPLPLHEDLEFLTKLDGRVESKISLHRSYIRPGHTLQTGFEQTEITLDKPAGYVRDLVQNELAAKGWKRAGFSESNDLVLKKNLPNTGAHLVVFCVTKKDQWPTITVHDQRRKLPQWRIWLHNLFN